MLEPGIKLLLSYLLGSVSGSLLVGRFFGGVDIRGMGSGNAGGTNALRTQGPLFALLVIIIDVGKGVVAALTVPGLALVAADPEVSRQWLAVGCGAAAVVGHIWPFWYQFRGGKGAGTLVGVYAALAPKLLLVMLLVWLVIVVLTGYVGLSTMLAAASAAVASALVYDGRSALLAFALAMTLLIVFAHRGNISRMLSGTENRMSKAMFWRRRTG